MTDHQLLVGIWFAASWCVGVEVFQFGLTISEQFRRRRFEAKLRRDFRKTIDAAMQAHGLVPPADPPEDAPVVH
jgi:hypothetical protein